MLEIDCLVTEINMKISDNYETFCRYVDLKACITQLPDNGYGANVTNWPSRLHQLPDRLQSIKMDAVISRQELLKAESKYWNEIVDSYVRAFHWKKLNLRNVLDMRAGFGGYDYAHFLAFFCFYFLSS
jgi:hypothetical protein